MSAEYIEDLKRYQPQLNEDAVDKIVKHLGIALKSRDGAIVSCSSKDERARVRDSWLKKKLAITEDDAKLDAAIQDVCEQMKGDENKNRVTFYYLLAEKFGKLDTLTG